jgi:branched-chain amino acid aminotransferase
MMGLVCYVNGTFCTAEEAKVSAFDHGFLYGDGVFESLTAADGRIFKLREHLDRLQRSARALRLALPEATERIGEIVKEAVRRSGLLHVYIRIIVTRGEGYPVLDPRVAKRPTLVVLLHEATPPPEAAGSYVVQGGGLRLKTAGVRNKARHNILALAHFW